MLIGSELLTQRERAQILHNDARHLEAYGQQLSVLPNSIKNRNCVQDVERGLQEAAAILNIVNIPLETYEDIAMEFKLDSMRRQSQENLFRLSTSGYEVHVTTPIGISSRVSSDISQWDS